MEIAISTDCNHNLRCSYRIVLVSCSCNQMVFVFVLNFWKDSFDQLETKLHPVYLSNLTLQLSLCTMSTSVLFILKITQNTVFEKSILHLTICLYFSAICLHVQLFVYIFSYLFTYSAICLHVQLFLARKFKLQTISWPKVNKQLKM